MFEEVIVCDHCGAEGCTVKEIAVQPIDAPRVSMAELADRQGRGETQSREARQRVRNRAFEILCLQCGHKHRFQPGNRKFGGPVEGSGAGPKRPERPKKPKQVPPVEQPDRPPKKRER